MQSDSMRVRVHLRLRGKTNLAFHCKCGHTRGNHDDCEKHALRVGKCNATINLQNGSIRCNCSKYNPDRKKNKRDYADIMIYKVVIWGLVSAICGVGLTQLDVSLSTVIVGFGFFIVSLYFYWFKIIKPFDEKFDKEKIEK